MKAWRNRWSAWLLAVMLLACQAGLAEAQVKPEVDPALKPYQGNGVVKIDGALQAGASDSIKRLFDLWTERFQHHHAGLKFETTGIQSAEAVPAIFKGAAPISEGADLVAISFPLSQDELQAIKAQRGVLPVRVAVALDAIVLVVNHKNPVKGLTLQQLTEIYAAPSGGHAEEAETWKQAGVDGKFGALEINRYGRDVTSGTYQAFKSMVLGAGEQRKDVRKEPGSMSVILEVGADERGIGYAATGYAARSKRVRIVPLARKSGDRFVTPTNDTLLSGEYPLFRELYIYAMPEPDGVQPAVKSFLQFVLSRDGQELAREEGFFPLPAKHSEQALGSLEQDGRVSSRETGTKVD